jgi:hypothetical protein
MECFPFVIVLAAIFLAWCLDRNQAPEPLT